MAGDGRRRREGPLRDQGAPRRPTTRPRSGGRSRSPTPDGEEETLTADVVLSAVGVLNRPQLPDVPGIDGLRGHQLPLLELARRPRSHRQARRARRRRGERDADQLRDRRPGRGAGDLPALAAVDRPVRQVPEADRRRPPRAAAEPSPLHGLVLAAPLLAVRRPGDRGAAGRPRVGPPGALGESTQRRPPPVLHPSTWKASSTGGRT